MANEKIAKLIAQRLREGMVHPGRDGGPPTPLALALFSTAGAPPEMVELVTSTTELLGEAIVALIETEGRCEIVDRDQVAELRIADQAAPRRQVLLHCRCDKDSTDPLAVLTVTNSPRVVVDAKQLLSGLAERTIECPHTRKA